MRHFIRGIALAASASCLPLAPMAAANGQVLTGTVRLACEAILCLSSGVRPGECAPALAHYFGISFKRWSDTIAARRDFLSMCPVVSSPGMPELINAIASGAGRCDAQMLNQRLRQTAYKWKEIQLGGDAGGTREVHEIEAIRDEKPLYCLVYENNQYTADLSSKYVGDPFHGGHWAEAKDYGAALANWQATHGNAADDGYSYSWTHPWNDNSYGGN